MTPEATQIWIEENFERLNAIQAWGETSFFYNPENHFSRGVYFCTIKEKNGDNDKASELDREGIWRLNFGLPKPDYLKLFGPPPTRPAKGEVIQGPWMFSETDQLMPHPIYGWMSWVAVLNPTKSTFERCKPLMKLSFQKSQNNFEARIRKEL